MVSYMNTKIGMDGCHSGNPSQKVDPKIIAIIWVLSEVAKVLKLRCQTSPKFLGWKRRVSDKVWRW